MSSPTEQSALRPGLPVDIATNDELFDDVAARTGVSINMAATGSRRNLCSGVIVTPHNGTNELWYVRLNGYREIAIFASGELSPTPHQVIFDRTRELRSPNPELLAQEERQQQQWRAERQQQLFERRRAQARERDSRSPRSQRMFGDLDPDFLDSLLHDRPTTPPTSPPPAPTPDRESRRKKKSRLQKPELPPENERFLDL
jgi:hypothetical protein